MALPSLVRTWQFQVGTQITAQGTSLATGRLLMRTLKNALLGQGAWTDSAGAAVASAGNWTVIGSSNSVAAGLDAVDRWATDANLVWAAAGVAHSWIVLEQSGTGVQICIDLSSATNTVATLTWSPAAGFTGGSTTARPTATDEGTPLSNGSWGMSTADATQRLHVMKSTDGLATRVFITTANQTRAIWCFERATNRIGAFWPEPSIATVRGSNATQVATIGDLTNGGVSRTRDSTANVAFDWTAEGNNSGLLPTVQTIPIDQTGDYPMFAIGMYATTAGHIGGIGSLVDVWWGLTNLAEASTYPAPPDTILQFCQFNDVIVPWNQSVPAFA